MAAPDLPSRSLASAGPVEIDASALTSEHVRTNASGLRIRSANLVTDAAKLETIAAEALELGVPLWLAFAIDAEPLTEVNEILRIAMALWDDFRVLPEAHFADRPELKDFRWTFERRLHASSGPEKLIINLTYACNNHCTFCAVGTRTQLHGHTESQRQHLDEYRARGVTMVDFDGGEPTLHPDLIGTVRYARQIGYQKVNVTTNGRMAFYEPYARKLARSGLTTLLFSVHGADPKSHARQVGVAEAFEQTTGGIKHCVTHAPKSLELGMNVTITKSNVDELPQLAQLAWDLGLRWINLQFLTPFGRATRSIAPDIDHAVAITRALIESWRDRMKVQIINLPFCFLPGLHEHLEGDLLKLARHMIFVNNEDVNLAEYLAERRVRKPVCETCAHAVFCGGFYELDKVPEPPWLVAVEDLIKKKPTASLASE